MAFLSLITTLLVLGSVCTVYSATITRAVKDGSEYIAEIRLGKNTECQGVQLSKEMVLALEGCVNAKNLKKYTAVVSGEARKITAVQSSDDGSLILLTTTTKKDKKTEFPGIASSTKGYDRVAYVAAKKKGFDEISFKSESASKCKKPLKGFNQNSQECLSSDAECNYENGLPIFGVSKKSVVISSFALDSLCSSKFKAAVSVVDSKAWIEDNIQGKGKDCGKLPKIKGGSYVLDDKKDTSAGATASVKCGKGLEASKDKITCQDSGKWETATCDKIECGKLPKLQGGSYVLDDKKDSSVGATASVKCDKGLEASLKKIKCLDSGKWEEAKCDKLDCGKLPKIKGGSYVLDDKKDTSAGATASVKCGRGLEASQKKIECLDSGKWEEAKCENIDCGSKLPKLEDGSYVLDNKKDTSAGATASVKCSKGFEASQKKIECLDSGDWEAAKCDAIDCGDKLPKIKDGTIVLDKKGKTTFGSKATVNCDKGYESKDKQIECEESGDWGKASCTIVDCGGVPKIKDGSYNLDKKKESTYEATATLTCDEDFFVKDGKDAITCEETGKWSKIGKCEEVKDCGKLKPLKNGNLELKGKKTKAGSKAVVTCDKGYDPNVDEIECLPTGKWETAECIIRDCGELDDVKKGSLKLDKKKASTVGETATLTCESGYEPTDKKSKITCQTSGKWEKTSCALKDCGKLGKIANGVYESKGSTTFGSSAKVKCDPGYDASDKEIDCLASGKWEKATCIIKDCGEPGKISNGVFTKKQGATTYQSKATLDCDKGYDASQKEIECQASGAWEKASCDIKDCKSPPNLPNGKYEVNGGTVYKSTANVVCNANFGSIAKTISCLETGSWSSAECKKDCGSVLPSVEFGTITVDDVANTIVDATATVTCSEGYDTNKASISCLASGSWETGATCTIYDCGPPSFGEGIIVSLDNSNSTTTFGETATVSCKLSDYAPTMGKTITCLSDGWETPVCVKDPCKAGFTLFDSHCYYYEAFTSLDWTAADTACDGYLAEISSEAEGDFLNRLRDSSMSAWIGLSDPKNKNKYKWAQTDLEPTYTNWDNLQPESPGKCVVMNPIGSWAVQDCSKKRNYFCELDPNAS